MSHSCTSAILVLFVLFAQILNGQSPVIDQRPDIKGTLVIAGGAMEPDNREVYTRLIDLAGGPDKANFAVIPAAGGVPMQSYILFRSTLLGYGVKPENIQLIPIAVMDDDSTLNINESLWKNNAMDAKLAEKIRSCSAVWFTGGDQARITQTLYDNVGGKTPVLQAIWDVYMRGGVIGGTSAGAAMMSDPMIGSGTSMGALVHKYVDAENDHSIAVADTDDTLQIIRGIGFFNAGLVDQHFEARARIGRLIAALFQLKEKTGSQNNSVATRLPLIDLGFGIDENTALIYYPEKKKIEAAGASGITIVNISLSKFSNHTPSGSVDRTVTAQNVRIDYITDGDLYDLTNGNVVPAGNKSIATANADCYNMLQGGILSSQYTGLTDLLTEMAECNRTTQISNLSFFTEQLAYRITLTKLQDFGGYISKDRHERYTVKGVRLDLEPVHVTYKSLK